MKKGKVLACLLVMCMVLGSLAACSRPGAGGSSGGAASQAAPAGGSAAEASGDGDQVVIKIGHTDSSQRSTHTWSVWLGEWLEEQKPGHFVVEVYPDSQLGDAPDLVAGVKLGTVTMEFDMATIVASATDNPAINCVNLPYLYSTYEEWEEGTFKNGGLELFNEMLEGSGYYCLGMYYNGLRQIISSKKVYPTVADMAGAKIRVTQDDLSVATLKAMGGNPTPMAFGEVLTSLSQGAIDGVDHALGVFNDFNYQDTCKFLTITNHASSPFPIVCSSDWFQALSEEDQKLIQEGVIKMCEQQRAEERQLEFGYLDKFREAGVEIYELNADELAAFKEACQPVFDMWEEQVGSEIMDKWFATVPK